MNSLSSCWPSWLQKCKISWLNLKNWLLLGCASFEEYLSNFCIFSTHLFCKINFIKCINGITLIACSLVNPSIRQCCSLRKLWVSQMRISYMPHVIRMGLSIEDNHMWWKWTSQMRIICRIWWGWNSAQSAVATAAAVAAAVAGKSIRAVEVMISSTELVRRPAVLHTFMPLKFIDWI